MSLAENWLSPGFKGEGMTSRSSKHDPGRSILIGVALVLAWSCKVADVGSSLMRQDKPDRPIDETPSNSAQATIGSSYEYAIFYANETDLDDAARAKRQTIVDQITALEARADVPATDKKVLASQKNALLKDEENFKSAVDQDSTQLAMIMCRNQGGVALSGLGDVLNFKRGLFVFTNRLFKRGKYKTCTQGGSYVEKDLPGLAEVTAAIDAESASAQPIYKNSPQAHKKTLENALKVVASQLAATDRVVLITKSHGNESNALVPPLQKTYSAEWFKRYLALLGAETAADHVSADASGGTGSTGSELGSTDGPLGSTDSALGSTDGALGDHGGTGTMALNGFELLGGDDVPLGEVDGSLGDVDGGLGEVGSALGGVGAGLKKDDYVEVINASKVNLSMVFLEACKTDLSDELVAKLKSTRATIKVWASDNEGLEYRTVSGYDKFDFTSKSFAQNLDEALRVVAGAK